MDPTDELMGADVMEHFIRHSQVGISRAISALAPINHEIKKVDNMQGIGINPGHEDTLNQLKAADNKLRQWQLFVDQTGPVNIFKRNKKPQKDNQEDISEKNYNNVVKYNEWKNSNSENTFIDKLIFSPSHQSSAILNNFVNRQFINNKSATITTIATQNINNDTQKEDNTNNLPKFAWVD